MGGAGGFNSNSFRLRPALLWVNATSPALHIDLILDLLRAHFKFIPMQQRYFLRLLIISMPLFVHFEITWVSSPLSALTPVSLRVFFELTAKSLSVSLRFHFGFTDAPSHPNPLRSRFESTSNSFRLFKLHSNSLRVHFDATSMPFRLYFGASSVPLRMHF